MRSRIFTLRKDIDAIDRTIIALLAARMRVAKTIGKQKKGVAQPIADRRREREMAVTRRVHAKQLRLDPHWLESLYRRILAQSKRIQRRV